MIKPEINNYIDWQKLFNDLFNYHKDQISDDRIENNDIGLILEYDSRKDSFMSETDECEVNGREIIFLFCHSLNNANESNNHSDTESYLITYDRVLEEFSQCEYECE